MRLARTLVPLALASALVSGCGGGAGHAPPTGRPAEDDPVLRYIRAIKSGGRRPTVAEMLPPLVTWADVSEAVGDAVEVQKDKPPAAVAAAASSDATEPAEPAEPAPPVARVLMPGDVIDLTVAGQPEFSGAVTVREDGSVALPTTGDPVAASGRTTDDFARAVADAVSPLYVREKPEVTAVLKTGGHDQGGDQ